MIGLSREYISISKSTGPLFIKELMRSKGIKNSVFAIRLDNSQGQSFMDLGTYSEDEAKPAKWFSKMPYS